MRWPNLNRLVMALPARSAVGSGCWSSARSADPNTSSTNSSNKCFLTFPGAKYLFLNIGGSTSLNSITSLSPWRLYVINLGKAAVEKRRMSSAVSVQGNIPTTRERGPNPTLSFLKWLRPKGSYMVKVRL
jgi:hypothetical protein